MHLPVPSRIVRVSQRLATLSLVMALFLADCITVIAHILRQASDLGQEYRQFV